MKKFRKYIVVRYIPETKVINYRYYPEEDIKAAERFCKKVNGKLIL